MAEIKGIFAFLGGILGWFFGGMDNLLYLLVFFVVLDYGSGLMAATVNHKISSSRGLQGILKKILIFALVGMGNALDMVLIPKGSPIRTAVIFFYLSNEGISILENIANMGLPIPKRLRSVLAQLKEDDHETNH